MATEQCYPCTAYGHECTNVSEVQPVVRRKKKADVPLLDAWPEGHWFDVALWSSWPSTFPHYVSYVEASSAFDAVERLMRHHGFWKIAYASVRACDGSIVYRCHKVYLTLSQENGS